MNLPSYICPEVMVLVSEVWTVTRCAICRIKVPWHRLRCFTWFWKKRSILFYLVFIKASFLYISYCAWSKTIKYILPANSVTVLVVLAVGVSTFVCVVRFGARTSVLTRDPSAIVVGEIVIVSVAIMLCRNSFVWIALSIFTSNVADLHNSTPINYDKKS